jgi:hypothetical protein
MARVGNIDIDIDSDVTCKAKEAEIFKHIVCEITLTPLTSSRADFSLFRFFLLIFMPMLRARMLMQLDFDEVTAPNVIHYILCASIRLRDVHIYL